ncbi:MAG: F0F1 ATP synthase subunit A [bacterium]|nr:F0F1 ATP synthase subunit A [bacterium]
MTSKPKNLASLVAVLALLTFAAFPAGATGEAHGDGHAATVEHVEAEGHADAGAAAGVEEHAAAADHATTAEHGEAHGEDHAEEHDPYHLPNFISIFWGDRLTGDRAAYLDPLFSALAALIIMTVLLRVASRPTDEPSRFHVAIEMLVDGLYGLVEGAIGPSARRYTPYLGTLFMFILINNFMGLVPFLHASTSSINTTVSLALCTFLYVQFIGIKENGPLGYLHHLAGSPRSGLEWGFVPLMFPLHVLGEFIKPLSLSLRLFGNIMGEDKLLAVFVVLGAGMLSFAHLPFGLPIQVPIMFLAMLTSTIQALVFTLLSTIYIALMLPHGEHEHAAAGHGH